MVFFVFYLDESHEDENGQNHNAEDDVRVADVEKSLLSTTCIVKSNGKHLIESIIGEKVYV